MVSKTQLSETRKNLMQVCFIPFTLPDFLGGAQKSGLSANVKTVVEVLRHNLTEAMDVASFPFTMGSELSNRELFQRLHMAARIRCMPDVGEEDDAVDENKAIVMARSEFRRMTEVDLTDPIVYNHPYSIMQNLIQMYENPAFKLQSDRLVRHSSVLSWNALEVFARDFLEAILNENATFATKFLGDADAISRFDLKKLTLTDLEPYGFNLSNRLGTFILDGRDLSDIESIKIAYKPVIYDKPDLVACLKSSEVYHLCKKRHLLVHRRGIVDRKFLQQTRCSLSIGDVLIVCPADLEKDIKLVWSVCEEICRSLATSSSEP